MLQLHLHHLRDFALAGALTALPIRHCRMRFNALYNLDCTPPYKKQQQPLSENSGCASSILTEFRFKEVLKS
jgi:hypothetical protein